MNDFPANPFPAKIRRVALIAPAGVARPEQVTAAEETLRRWGITPVTMPHVHAGTREKYLAAADIQRAAELEQAWLDPDIDLLLCVRGGFGCAHLLPRLHWERLRLRPMPLVGYSDVTALHLAMIHYRAGTPIAGPMAIRMPQIADDAYTRERFARVLDHAVPELVVRPDGAPLTVIRSGRCAGPVFAANLAVMVTLCGTGRMPDLSGWILVVEDIGEPVYRLDRYLTQLEQGDLLRRCAGLVFGGFTDCGDPDEQMVLFRRIAATFDGPVVSGFPFGHSFPLFSLRQGGPMTIDDAVMTV